MKLIEIFIIFLSRAHELKLAEIVAIEVS